MSVENILSADSLEKGQSFVAREYSSFFDSQGFSYRDKDFDSVKSYQFLFLGGFYAAKDSYLKNVSYLDDASQRMFFSAVSSANLLNSVKGFDLDLPIVFSSFNFSVSDYESNIRILKKHREEAVNREEIINTSYSFFSGLNNFLVTSLNGSVSQNYIKIINSPRRKLGAEHKNGSHNRYSRDLVSDVDPVDFENISFDKTKYDDIIGNVDAKDALKSSMERLFLYDSDKKMNPALEKKQFKQKYLLVGEPGNGKGMLAAYAASIGSDLSQELGRKLRMVSMESYSRFQDGPVLKLLDYLKDISKGDDLFLVILDEIDAMCPSRLDSKTQHYQRKLVTELLKFTSSSVDYINKGNYVLVSITNTPDYLDRAFINRLNSGIYLCEGPKTAEEKVSLIKKSLYDLMPEDKVRVGNWDKIGSVAYDLSLSGREINDCVNSLIQKTSLKELPRNVHKLSYEKKLAVFDDFKTLNNNDLLNEIVMTGERRRVENYLMKGGYLGNA